MKTVALTPEELAFIAATPAKLAGMVVATNVSNYRAGSGFLFRKGDVLKLTNRAEWQAHLLVLAKYAPPDFELHLLSPEVGDLTEDEAGKRLALLIAGQGLRLTNPVESRVNMVATRRGLLQIDLERLDRLNEIPGVAVFTLYDRTAVEAGTEVCGAKVIPLVYPASYLAEVATIVADKPVVQVAPFLPLRVGVIVREQLKPGPRQRFEQAVKLKLAWFGAFLVDIITVDNHPASLIESLKKLATQEVNLILHVGGHASDPLDPVFPAMASLNIEMARLGAPAHPGTLFWLAYWGEVAIFGLASCGMFSKTTLGDLFMARLMAGERLTNRDIARMGHGGLFTRQMAFRFPPYGLSSDED